MRGVAVLAVCGLLATSAWAERIVPVDKAIVVRLEVNKPTSVEFPEPIVDVAVLKRPDLYSTNQTGPYLYIYPYTESVEGRMFVVCQSGKQYMVDFKIASPADDRVRLTQPLPTATSKAQPFSLASWFRALRSGRAVPGFQAVEVPAPMPADGRVAVMASRAVGQGSIVGVTLTVHNTTAQPLQWDLRIGEPLMAGDASVVALSTWAWPPRFTVRGVATETEQLEPGGQGAVYVVLERRVP